MTRLDSDFSRFMTGLDAVERLMLAAYGANGGNVLLCGANERRCFDDGYKALELLEPEDAVGMEAVKQLYDAATAAHGLVGDGTSTTVLLTAALIRAGRKLRDEGHSAREVVSAIRSVASDILSHMKERAEAPSEADLCAAVSLAMHGDTRTGGMLGAFLHKAGKDAVVVAQSVAGGKEIELEQKEGLVWSSGVAAKEMLGGALRKDLNGAHVILSAVPQSDMNNEDWKAVNHAFAAVGGGPLLLICPDASGSVLATFTRHASSGGHWCIVGIPGGVNPWIFLSDLAEIIGGTVIDDTKGNLAQKFDASWFGRIEKFHATETNSCIEMDAMVKRNVSELKALLNALLTATGESLSDAQKGAIKERLPFLSGFYGNINIPYLSQSQWSALWESVQDGVLAGRAALKGVLPGCSKALRTAALSAQHSLLTEAASIPFMSTWNAQVHKHGPEMPEGDLSEYWNTVDTRNGKVVNAREAGILDSLAVLEAAVNIAVEVAIPIIEANILIVVEPGKDLPAYSDKNPAG